MLKKVKGNFDRGVERLKWFSSLFSDRVKIEISVMKLLFKSEEMEKQRQDLFKTIGMRVHELNKQAETQTCKDTIIAAALSEIEQIEAEMESTRQKASEISRIGD